jgi:hypothetical protein
VKNWLERWNGENDRNPAMATRRILFGFGYKLFVYTILALPPAMHSDRPLAKYIAVFGGICAVAMIVCGITAMLLRQAPGGRALNHWDEAFAFAGLFLLARWAAS